MGQPIPLSTQNPVVKLTGSAKVLREFGGTQDFKTRLEALLATSGLTGEFNAFVDSRLKGSAHTRGFQLGTLSPNRRSVEIRWQPGGNDTRFSVQVSTPHGMEPYELHQLLDQAQQKADSEADLKPANDTPATDAQEVLSETELELFFRELAPSATEAGMVVRQQCLDILGTLDRQDGNSDLATLVASQHLELGATDAFLRIGPEWLAKLRAPQDTVRQPVPEPSKVQVPTMPNNLLAEAERLSGLVAGAQQRRQRLPELQREVSELESTIASSQERLALINPELEEVKGFLANPEVDEAERTLTTLRGLLMP